MLKYPINNLGNKIKIMHLPIIISRLSNLLFFIQKTNRHNLIKFDLQKYLANESFNLSFYGKNENKIWKQIKKSIGEKNTKQIKKTIVLLKPVFTSHWRKTSKHLILWKRYFQSNQLLLQKAVLDVKKLSGAKYFAISKVPIYLMSDFKNKDKEINAWFSWTPKESFIVVEIPFGLKIPNNFFPLGILAHEFFHLILKENKIFTAQISKIAGENAKLFTKLSKKHISGKMFLEELLISSFIPEGYLSEKYFGIKVNTYILKPKVLLDWRKLIAFKLKDAAKKYTESGRKINTRYLRRIIDIIQ